MGNGADFSAPFLFLGSDGGDAEHAMLAAEVVCGWSRTRTSNPVVSRFAVGRWVRFPRTSASALGRIPHRGAKLMRRMLAAALILMVLAAACGKKAPPEPVQQANHENAATA